MPPGRLFSLHVAARMLDFFDEYAHWQRRLWNVGLVLSLREVLEAGEEQGRSLTPAAVRALAESVSSRANADPGAGTEAQKRAITGYLQRELDADGFAHRAIATALHDIELHYLDRWQEAFATGPTPGRELTARVLASHLLDAGLTPAHLHRWLTALRNEHEDLAIADLIGEAKHLLATPPSEYELFIPFELEPRTRGPRPPEWVNSSAAAAWLRDYGHEPLQQRGGFVLRFEAQSPDAVPTSPTDSRHALPSASGHSFASRRLRTWRVATR
jgi:hypothetical protein